MALMGVQDMGEDFTSMMEVVKKTFKWVELKDIKVRMQDKAQTDSDLFSQLSALTKSLNSVQLQFLEEVLMSLGRNVWSMRNIMGVIRIFGHSETICPVLFGKLMDYQDCRNPTVFEAVISRCLGCIKCFEFHILNEILNSEASITALKRACKAKGPLWDAEANGCFASYLPRLLWKRRRVGKTNKVLITNEAFAPFNFSRLNLFDMVIYVNDGGKSMIYCKASCDRELVMEFLKYNDCLHLTDFRGDRAVVLHAMKYMDVQAPHILNKRNEYITRNGCMNNNDCLNPGPGPRQSGTQDRHELFEGMCI